jgi:uncharacterized protein (DUF1778 family)
MAQTSGGEPEKTFSGRLPFRTKPEIHELIYRAAKQKGVSLNSWMEHASKQVAEQELHQATEQAPTSTGLAQQLMQKDPQTFFRLVDRLQKELKPQGIEHAIIWMSQVQTLMQDFDRLQTHLEMDKMRFSEYLEKFILSDLKQNPSQTSTEKFLEILSILLRSFGKVDRSIEVLSITTRQKLIETLFKLRTQFKSDEVEIFLTVISEVVKTLEAQIIGN